MRHPDPTTLGRTDSWEGVRVVVAGFGTSGAAAVDNLLHLGADVRAVAESVPADQLGALLACDITPPAAWNALGARGWVPTVELTAHVRARQGVGPLSVRAWTHHVQDGFLEEDALVHDADGRLIVQSRQLARWTA